MAGRDTLDNFGGLFSFVQVHSCCVPVFFIRAHRDGCIMGRRGPALSYKRYIDHVGWPRNERGCM